jgi:dihydrofolate reductase
MAKLVFGMNQSLDGYVDHMAFAPGPTLFRHFIEEAQRQAGSVYGRQMYEVMRYWDDDHPEWDAEEHAFAAAWRKQPKWVVSRSLKSVGPNARLVGDDLEGAIRELKAERDGEIEVAGPDLAHSLTELGLIDEYRIYLHPVVLGHGKPYFAGPRPPLRLMTHDTDCRGCDPVDLRSCLISRLAAREPLHLRQDGRSRLNRRADVCNLAQGRERGFIHNSSCLARLPSPTSPLHP